MACSHTGEVPALQRSTGGLVSQDHLLPGQVNDHLHFSNMVELAITGQGSQISQATAFSGSPGFTASLGASSRGSQLLRITQGDMAF